MAKLLFKLNNVPDDEIFEVRALLTERKVSYYETTAGNWGVSLAAIWLHNDDDYEEAKALLDEYQCERVERAREPDDDGVFEVESFAQRALRKPLQVVATLLLIAGIAYVSIAPFLNMYSE